MNTETKHTPGALAAASAIRKLNTIEADTLLALFDTGKQDREACEQIIIGKFAEVIDRETKLPDMAKELAQLRADKANLETEVKAEQSAHFQLGAAESVFRDIGAPYDYGQTLAVNLKRLITAQKAKHEADKAELVAALTGLSSITEYLAADWASLEADTQLPEKEQVSRTSFYKSELAKSLNALGEATENAQTLIAKHTKA